MAYTDKEMLAFSQIAYWDLEDAFNNLAADGNGKVPLTELLTESQQEALMSFGVTRAEIDSWSMVGVYDANDTTGMYACIIETGEGEAAVAYRGSEDMGVLSNVENDWVKADLGLLNSTMTNQQEEVRNFLGSEKYRELLDGYDNLAFTGHSLGGNLAEYSTIISEEYGLDDNIVQCLSLDGPGFSYEFIAKYRDQIAKMSEVMEHARWSFVGGLLNDLPGVEYRYVAVTNERTEDAYNLLTRHSLVYVEMYGDSFAAGEQDDFAKATSIMTEGMDHLPGPIGNIMVTAIGGAWIGATWLKDQITDEKGNITPAGYAIIANIVHLINVIGWDKAITVAAGLIAVVVTVVAVAVLTEIVYDVVVWIAEAVYENLKKLYNWTVEQINALREAVQQFIDKVSHVLNYTLNAGYRYAQNHTYIRVDTAKLRSYSARLDAVNRRLTALDRRLDGLYTQVGLQNVLELLKADAVTGYCWRLNRCISYLNSTASNFEAADRSIASQG